MTREEMLELAVSLVDEINELNEMVHWLNCQLEAHIQPTPEVDLKTKMVNLIAEGKFIASVVEYKNFHRTTIANAKTHAEILRSEILRGKYGEENQNLVKRRYPDYWLYHM